MGQLEDLQAEKAKYQAQLGLAMYSPPTADEKLQAMQKKVGVPDPYQNAASVLTGKGPIKPINP